MNVDKSTKPRWINIVIDKDQNYFNELKKQADEDGCNDEFSLKESGGIEHLAVTMDKHSFDTDEFYYDADSGELTISGMLTSDAGKTYLAISIPLSDAVLIDILHHSIKKLNKLKTALEALK